jgi:hypothetical protein
MSKNKTGINWGKIASKVEGLRNAHGTVNQDALFELCKAEIAEHCNNNEIAKDVLKTAVDSVFNKLPPADMKLIDMNGVITGALRALNTPDTDATRVGTAIRKFLRGESDRFEATNGAEGFYHVKLGSGGGVRPSTAKYIADYKKRLADKRNQEVQV